MTVPSTQKVKMAAVVSSSSSSEVMDLVTARLLLVEAHCSWHQHMIATMIFVVVEPYQ